jgi:hypothetical protein
MAIAILKMYHWIAVPMGPGAANPGSKSQISSKLKEVSHYPFINQEILKS